MNSLSGIIRGLYFIFSGLEELKIITAELLNEKVSSMVLVLVKAKRYKFEEKSRKQAMMESRC